MKTVSILLLTISLICDTLTAQTLNYNDTPLFLTGINIPWKSFGWDFGHHPRSGIAYDGDHFENIFREVSAAGGNVVRIWLHCDGRASPEFDTDGFVLGLEAEFFQHLDDFLARLERYDLMVIFTLWSHDMGNSEGGRRGPRTDLISDRDKLESYVENALKPLVLRYRDNCQILAWDLINEPEWVMEIPYGGITEQTVSREEMIYFVGRCAQAIHEVGGQMVTVASAWAFLSSRHFNSSSLLWEESVFQEQGLPCHSSYLDYYTMHYYPYMSRWFSPFHNNVSTFGFNRPVVVGESPLRLPSGNFSLELGDLSPLERLERTRDNGFAGLLFWSYQAGDGFGSWREARESMSVFSRANEQLITPNLNCDETARVQRPVISCQLYPNPGRGIFYLQTFSDEIDLEVKVFDLSGRLLQNIPVRTVAGNTTELNLKDLSAGLYLIHINALQDGTPYFLQQQKLLITP